ncbi:MAG: cellulase family glycosylhydrolase [Bacteroidota bacterium]|nr:cellulase family glycosylhydrolase [Bacteroidota bacterium]
MMKILKHIFLIQITALCFAQSGEMPFSRGVNLSTWFQESNIKRTQFSKYTKSDFENIKSLGCDVIRLPINMHAMTKGAPDYIVEPLLFDFLDQAVSWAEELGLHIILDNHSFDPAISTSPSIRNILIPVWKQMAEHMKNRSSLVYYEVLNEPHGIGDDAWNAIQKIVIDSIRSVDKFHTIIVGPAGWNGYNNLALMPAYADTNLIYTFHFYDPFIFTHQGASWADPSMVPLAGVPFPYDAARMPAFPPSLAGTWIQNEFNNYSTTGTANHVKSFIDIAANFKNSRNVRIFCGEFGVYIPNSNNDDRVRWYELVRTYLESKGISWTSWDYQGGFGLFKSGTDELFDYDINVPLITALGLNVPPQKQFTIVADTVGFDLYKDYVGMHILQSTYSSNDSALDFYSDNAPAEGKYCIRWSGAQQYENIGFGFMPTKNLSALKNNGSIFNFFVRSNFPGLQFDIRFVDTKTGPSDHPWRMRKIINSSIAPWDGLWHQVRIPLSEFAESGSWDNDTWYNPEGKFDWSAVDRFEIVAEQMALTGKEVWFDDIRITPASSAFVDASSLVPSEFKLFQNYPNPFNPSTTIRYQLPHNAHVTMRIFNVLGQVVETLVDERKDADTYQVRWIANGSAGVYFCRLQAGDFIQTTKLLLMK